MGSYIIIIVILILGLEIARYFRKVNRSIEEIEDLRERVASLEKLIEK